MKTCPLTILVSLAIVMYFLLDIFFSYSKYNPQNEMYQFSKRNVPIFKTKCTNFQNEMYQFSKRNVHFLSV